MHQDRLGSVIASSDATGAVSGKYAFGPFGETSNTSSYGYNGQTFDAATGLYYYRARMYSPVLGRFMQTDPIGYNGGSNLYAYVGNDPMNATDPLGLSPDEKPNQNSDLAEHEILLANVKKLQPDPNAEGAHSTFGRNPDGQVDSYTGWENNPYTNSWTPSDRFRLDGKPHGPTEPPIYYERPEGKGVGAPPSNARPADPVEIPRPPLPPVAPVPAPVPPSFLLLLPRLLPPFIMIIPPSLINPQQSKDIII